MKTEIIILTWDGDSSGFDWEPTHDRTGTRLIRDRFHTFAGNPRLVGSTSVFTLATLKVAGYAPDQAGRTRITDLIDGELQDAIAAGLVGHILNRFHINPSLEGTDQ